MSWPDLSTAGPTPAGDGAHDAALLIGIEDYATLDDVGGARGAVDAWYRWLAESRRVPLDRLHRLVDRAAVDHKIRSELALAAAEAEPGGTLWVVFVGHGAPSPDGADGLLIGADADRSADGIAARSVPRSALLAALEGRTDVHPVVVLDACFSGQAPSGEALVPGLQPVVPIWALAPSAGASVLTATSSGEFAGALPGTGRPAFSYLVLGALRGWGDADHDGVVRAAEAVAYAKGALRATVHDRSQVPSLLGPDLPLARGAEAGPDLVALALAPAPSAPAPAPAPAPAAAAPPAPGSAPAAVREVSAGGVTVRVVAVPAGSFTMGASGREDNLPHPVRLTRPFELMEHEVTQAEWTAVTGKNPARFAGCPDCPVERVSWEDAVAFAAALSDRMGLAGDARWRLPTEAEWEYAARAGADTTFAGSEVADRVAWTKSNAGEGPHRACALERNAWGLCDLSGNVWEWVADRYAKETPAGGDDPSGAAKGASRGLRGGSWWEKTELAAVASRDYESPDTRDDDVGLRLARTAAP